MDSKTFIGIALMMLVYFVFLMPKPPAPGEIDEDQIKIAEASPESNPEAATQQSDALKQTQAPERRPKASTGDSSFEKKALNQSVRLQSDRISLETNGLGEIQSLVLRKYSSEPNSEERVRYEFGKEQVLNTATIESAGGRVNWTSATYSNREIVLMGSNSQGLKVTRRIELAPENSYSLKYIDEIQNSGSRSQSINLRVRLQKEPHPKQESDSFFLSLFMGPPDIDTSNWYTDESMDYENLMDLPSESSAQKVESSMEWAGFSDKYFFQGFVPRNFDIKLLEMSLATGLQNETGRLAVQNIDNGIMQLPPGEKRTLEYSFYIGPKKIPELQKVSESLGRAVDYGDWIGPISRFLLLILLFFHSLIPNYGIAIVLLTFAVKLVLLPLAWKATYSMRKLSTVQPMMKEIQQKYKKDPQRLQAEMMALYKREKVNPLGGCFPILLQMPVFFALYRLFFASFEMRHAPFFGWIQDLSAYDPFFITPIAMVFLMYFQQKLTPMPMGGGEETEAVKIQKKLIKWMPFMFGAIMLFLPAGLTLYFLVNAGVSVLQQYFMNKRLDKILPRPSNEVLKAANGN